MFVLITVVTNKNTNSMKTLKFETSVSDHHKPITTMLRLTFAKGKPKYMFHHCCKNVKGSKKNYKNELLSVSDFESFQFALKVILNQFASLKQKLVRSSNQPFLKLL